MKKEEVLEKLKKTLGKNEIVGIAQHINQAGLTIEELIDLTLDQEPQVAFRAAWVLENYYVSSPDHFSAVLPLFLQNISRLKNPSVQRHYAKALAFITSKNAPMQLKDRLDQMSLDEVVDVVFTWLISESVPVAVKSHCLNILANLSSRYEWITQELSETMDFLIDTESIAFYAKAKQIRKQLKYKSS